MTQIDTRPKAGEAVQRPVHGNEQGTAPVMRGIPVQLESKGAPVRIEPPTSTPTPNSPTLSDSVNHNFNIHMNPNAPYPSPPPAASVPGNPATPPVIIPNNISQEGGCAHGVGWKLFITGWFCGVPWFVGAGMLLCEHDQRERSGLIACAIASVILVIVIIAAAASR